MVSARMWCGSVWLWCCFFTGCVLISPFVCEMNWLAKIPHALLRSGCRFSIPAHCQTSRYLTSTVTLPPDIEFQELKNKLEEDRVTLIDVRTPSELVTDGKIPKSKNLVLQMLGVKILIPEEDFAKQLGFSKPKLDEPVVVSCLGGIRARTAQLAMMGVGYTNVRVYVGSYEDWIEKGGPVEYPEPETQEE
nr:rhodanese domain-containing protein CG4456-like [Procambarus clarkii]